MIESHLREAVMHITLRHRKASALDLELCEALREEFELAAEREDVRALILTGTGSIFSAGVDLPRLIDSGGDYVLRFVEALDAMLRALFLFPKPAVAALNGHAIAGGAIMAFASDYRLMSGGRIGVPEALVGVPFPPLALEIVRFAVARQYIQSLIYLGWTVEPDRALALGLIDEVVPGEQLLPRALEIARQVAEIAPDAFRLTKRQLREPFLRHAAHIASTTTDTIDALWAAPQTHARIRAYLAKTIGKK